VIRANAGAIVSMKIFVMKQNQVAPVAGHAGNVPEFRQPASSIFSSYEDMTQPARNLTGNLPQIRSSFRTRRAWNLEIFAVIVIEIFAATQSADN